MTDFEQKPEILENYFLLESLGIIEHIDQLSQEIHGLEDLLKEASEIFQKRDIPELIDFITSCLGSKFVPTNLTFLFLDQAAGIQSISYRDLRPVECPILLKDFSGLETFFTKYPRSIHFDLFAYEINNQGLVEELRKVNPQIVVPIIGIAGLYGLVLFGPKLLETQYTDEEIRYLDRLMKFTGISFQNLINYKNAVTDLKTGLYNHSFFMKRLGEEWSKVRRYGGDLGLLVLDIDHFKGFNDTYGHMAGDLVIESIGKVIREAVRESDVVARFGGEEFTVLLDRTDRVRTWSVAERIRTSIEKTKVAYKGQSLSVTVSVGAATYRYNVPEVMDDLIINADEALYQAKKLSRNRTVMYGESLLFSILKKRV